MADETNVGTNGDLKLTRLGHLRMLAQRVKTISDQVDALEAAGGEPNVLEGVKVNSTALTIANKMVNILIQESDNNGKIKVNGSDVMIHGLAALAYKAEVSASELSTALAAVINAKAEASTVSTLSSTLSTLVGSDSGKSARTIANEELAAQLIPADAQEALDTLQEIADWIQDHPGDVAAINSAISALETLTGGFGSGTTIKAYIDAMFTNDIDPVLDTLTDMTSGFSSTQGSIKSYIDTAITNLNIGSYATKVSNPTSGNFAGLDANGNLTDSGKKASDFVAAVSGKGLSTNDYTTAEKTKLSGISTGANKVEASLTNGNIKIDGSETTVYTLPYSVLTSSDVATNTEVEDMITDVLGADTSSS